LCIIPNLAGAVAPARPNVDPPLSTARRRSPQIEPNQKKSTTDSTNPIKRETLTTFHNNLHKKTPKEHSISQDNKHQRCKGKTEGRKSEPLGTVRINGPRAIYDNNERIKAHLFNAREKREIWLR
jgi:hypothetical protein